MADPTNAVRPREFVIVGAGGFGREMATFLNDCWPSDSFRIRGFLAQETDAVVQNRVRYPILGDPDTYQPRTTEQFLLAIGAVPSRRRVVEALTSRGGEFVSFIHPTAVIASGATIGTGCVLAPHTMVSNGASLANYTLLNYYASAGHDSVLGRFSVLSPYATLNGHAIVEEHVFVGTHAVVAPGVRVGQHSVVGAGAIVLQDVAARSFVRGVPAKASERNQD